MRRRLEHQAYMLIMLLQVVNGRVMGGRIRQASTTSPQA